MSDFDSNPYYHPEVHGLETVGTVQWGIPCYDFDITAVWKNAEGEYFLADDSGCSCPTPFEYVIASDLKPMTAHQVVADLQERLEREQKDDYKTLGDARMEVTDLIARIMMTPAVKA